MIGSQAIEGSRVLDLYAGTGTLGIEALSRGALAADFVEVRPVLCRDIRKNLQDMGLAHRGRVIQARADKALDLVTKKYDLVLIDPPYDLDPWETLMSRLSESCLLKDKAIVVAEHRYQMQLADEYGYLVRLKSRRHGDTSISVYRTKSHHG